MNDFGWLCKKAWHLADCLLEVAGADVGFIGHHTRMHWLSLCATRTGLQFCRPRYVTAWIDRSPAAPTRNGPGRDIVSAIEQRMSDTSSNHVVVLAARPGGFVKYTHTVTAQEGDGSDGRGMRASRWSYRPGHRRTGR